MNRLGPFVAGLLLFAVLASAQDEPLLKSQQERIAAAAEKGGACVVGLLVTREAPSKPAKPNTNAFADGGVFQNRPNDSACSGTILSEDGYVLTSYFNVKPDPRSGAGAVQSIEVILPGGGSHTAELVGFHQDADLALLKIDAKGLPTLRGTNLAVLKSGLPVVALGRDPEGKTLTVTPGIVSAPGRLHSRAVQIDCKLNYGNTGGPVLDLEGRMVGVACKVDTKYAANIGQNSGVHFAVTFDKISELLPDLKKGVKVTGTGLPFLGIQPDPAFPEIVKIAAVVAGTAADNAGIKPGDIITEMDGRKIKTFDELRATISRKAIGDRVKLVVQRTIAQNDETVTQNVELEAVMGERPGE